MKVFKYPVEVTDNPIVSLPKGAKVLHFGVQADKLCLWALVDEKEEVSESYMICIRGTGHELLGNEGEYLASVQIYDMAAPNGQFVWHIFKRL